MPASQVLMNDTDILAIADYVTRSKVVPLIKSVRQDYFVVSARTQLVTNQVTYDIPSRALARTLRDLKLVDSSGNRRDMALIALEDEHLFRTGTLPVGFYFKGDKVAIVPKPTDSNYGIELWWEMPPSKLVSVSSAAIVQSVVGDDVTVNGIPSGFNTGVLVDFIKGISGNSTIDYDIAITNIAGNTISFGAGLVPPSLVPGDYISLAETTPVLQLPNEAEPYLETTTAKQVLKAIGDYEGSDRLNEDEEKEATNLKILLEPRIEGEATKIINRRSLVRGWRGRFLTSGYYY